MAQNKVKIPVKINLVLPQHLAVHFYHKAKANMRQSTGTQVMWELERIFLEENKE